ncbi:MAG: molybdopterin cofactor-binding domain-containing protein [Synergistaceae bacterium]|nr:molybdopterin cofactor-binding domain-containing protein [Synergistaceae bacterium]
MTEANYHVKNLTINGVPRRIIGKPETSLLTVIRDQLKMTGTKRGCDHGQCGVCNVILNGKVVRSCITKWKNVPEYSEVTTIEGIGTPENLHALQWAFIVCGAIQCGFCTPGFITAGKVLLDSNPSPTREEVREWYSKHWMACRCTGYVQVVDAVMKAAAILRGEEKIEDLAKMYKPGDSLWNSKYPRPSAVYKATGLWDFGDDDRLKLPEEFLFAYPFALEGVRHAKVNKIDTSEAEKMPGVYKIVTYKDIKANKGTNRIRGQVGCPSVTTDGWERRIMVEEGDKIRQWGECIAIVCADTEANARAASDKIKVDYEPLPELIDIYQAKAADAVKVYDEIEGIDGMPNAFNKRIFTKGADPKEDLDKAPYIVEDEFYSSRQPHMVLETDCGYAYYDEENRVTLATKSICVYRHQMMIARGVGVAPSKIRVIQNNMGASFGYKVAPTNEPYLAIALVACQRPVYMRINMKEHNIRTPKRSPFLMHIRVGADKSGRLIGAEQTWWVDHGPYSESSNDLTNKGGQFFFSPYAYANMRATGYTCFSNHRWSAAFRAYGAPQTYWGCETAMDMLAEKCGIDPFDFREMNLLQWEPFTTNPLGVMPSGYAPEVFPLPEMMKKARPYYEEMKKEAAAKTTDKIKFGVGVSIGIYNSNDDGADEAASNIELTKDGVIVYNTWEDHGQGADMGCLGTAHEALKPLNLHPTQIKMVLSDTAKAPNSGAAAASRSQVMVGNAIVDSCKKLLEAMRKPDGTYRTYDEMIAENIPVFYEGYTQACVQNADGSIEVCSGNDKDTGLGKPFGFHMFAVNLAMVSVNMETGKAHCEKFVLVGDVGVINNYLVVDGQQYGGIAQGIGLALTEDFLDESKYNNFVTMGLPYIKDVPDDIKLIHVETPRPLGPFGASGTGEMPLAAPHIAVCNAIKSASGVRIKAIPATPDKILAGLKEKA